ncbi:phage tail terminator protein [Thiorhodococcus fuscus]|uniref:DUF3168 domain-containing protein n=1 Tax=Thiorhodococcus fuscus TaxID=527200 RepID=A0ABW4YBD7_9GAMM
MSVAVLIDRLSAECPIFQEVEEPTATNPMERDAYPVATVYPAARAPSGEIGGHQLAARRYAVLVTASGAAQLEDALAEISVALDGWRPPASAKPLRYVGGKLAKIDGVRLQWSDTWEFETCVS